MSQVPVTSLLLVLFQLIIGGTSNTGNTQCVVNSTWPDDNPQLVPAGYTAFNDIGVAYKFHNYTRTWNKARKQCNSEGAHLAVIDSRKKIEHAITLHGRYHSLHVGIHRFFDNSEWVSVITGVPILFMQWAPATGEEAVGFQCVILWYDGQGVAANDCNNQRKFICEVPLS